MRFEASSWMCWKTMLGFAPLGTGMGAAGARLGLGMLFWRWACWISFCEGGCRSGMGTAMLKDDLGLSRALNGALS